MNFGIIAAGEGSRLVSEGIAFPKPLVPLCGQPMIGRLIRLFEEQGAGKICVIINEQMTEVARYLEQFRMEGDCELDIQIHTTPSSMHSFHYLGQRLRGHGRFIVTTVDTIFRPEEFGNYVRAWENAGHGVEGMMAVTSHIDDEKPLYVEVSGDRITRFLDQAVPGIKYVSGGIYGLSDRALDVLDKCIGEGISRMRNYQRALVAEGLDLKAFDMGKILDVDHAGDIVKAEEYLQQLPERGSVSQEIG